MLRVFRGGWSLRVRLVVLLALAILPARLTGLAFISRQADSILRQKAQRELELRTRDFASNVRAWDNYMVLALDNLRGLSDIVSMDPARQRPVLAHMSGVYTKLIMLGTVDAEGRNIARSDTRAPLDYRKRRWFAEAMSGKPISRQTVLSLTSGSPSVAYAAPVRDAAGKVVGAVVCAMDERDILREVGAGRFGKTGCTFVVDEVGRAVAYPDSDTKTLPSLGDLPPVRAMPARPAPTMGSFTDEQNHRWLYHAIRLENGWGAVGMQREDEALEQARNVRSVGWGIIAGSSLLGLVIIWVIAGRTLLPIRRLTKAVQSLAAGNWGQRVPDGAPGELGGLVAAFNAMSEQLHAAYRTFEERVAQRTAELEGANRKLQASRGELQAALVLLRDSEEEFRATFERAGVGMAQVEPGTARYTRVNRRLCEIMGYSEQELLELTFIQLTHPADRLYSAEAQRQLLAGEMDQYVAEKRYIRKDGAVIWAHVTVAPMRDSSGELVRMTTVVEDVTDRKLAEQALREQTELVETLNRVGRAVAAELDLRQLLKVVTDAAARMTRVRFAAFFYQDDESGRPPVLSCRSGDGGVDFTPFVGELSSGRVKRVDELPPGSSPLRSYLAVPVVSRSGTLLGGLFLGHGEGGAFRERDERMAEGIAAQAGVGIENARLFQASRQAGHRMAHQARHDALTGLPNRAVQRPPRAGAGPGPPRPGVPLRGAVP